MHRTDLVKRAFDHDTDVGAQISEEKPARARAHVQHTFKCVFVISNHTVKFEGVCTNPRTHVMEPLTLTKARVRAQWSWVMR